VEQFRERFFAKFRKPPRVHDWMAEICPRWVAAAAVAPFTAAAANPSL
jgi:hypothetical protein